MINYLITFQNPTSPRERYIVRAGSTFGAMLTLFVNPLIRAETYVAVRPATSEDLAKYLSREDWARQYGLGET